MKCYLHIGTEKTATTTIQKFLNINQKKLATHGLGFSQASGKLNNRQLVIAAFNERHEDVFSRRLTTQSQQGLPVIQKQIIEGLRKEFIEFGKTGIERVVFSSEHIQSRLTHPIELQRLKSILENLGYDDVQIIIYLRNPADLAASLYSTQIKAG
jgi:hypothetical protein